MSTRRRAIETYLCSDCWMRLLERLPIWRMEELGGGSSLPQPFMRPINLLTPAFHAKIVLRLGIVEPFMFSFTSRPSLRTRLLQTMIPEPTLRGHCLEVAIFQAFLLN
jgi:hypothetical protein